MIRAERRRDDDSRHPRRPGACADEIVRVLGYVPVVARRYASFGVPMDELVAAGNLGVVEAARRFDRSRGVKFITYADWWIRKLIVDTLDKQRGPVRLPRHQWEKLRSVRAARARHLAERGTEPDPDTLHREAGVAADHTDRLTTTVRGAVSLDQRLSPRDERRLSDTLAHPDSDAAHTGLARRDDTRRLRRHLLELDPRERRVLRLRFGLDGGEPQTLRVTGSRLGLSRERVRQIELRALTRLRGILD